MAAVESLGSFTDVRTANFTRARPWSMLTPVTLPTTTPATFTLSALSSPVASSNDAVSV